MMKKYNLVPLILLLGTNLSVFSQSFQLDVNALVGTPKGVFMDELNRNSIGVDLALTYQIENTPIYVGTGITLQNYGWKERDTYLYNAPEIDVSVRTTNNIVTPYFILKLEEQVGRVSPFIEAQLGINYLYTESTLIDSWDEEEIASDINYDYYTTSSGFGGGLKFKLYEGFTQTGKHNNINLVLKGKFMNGGNARYLKEGDLHVNGNDLILNVRESRTDIISYSVGISFSF